METLEQVLILIALVLVSALIDKKTPSIATPLVQIALGCVAAIIAGGDFGITIEPELFLVLFIAPLIFAETKHTDKLSVWKNRSSVLILAIIFVIVSTIIVGLALHWLLPDMPIAYCFALGAALGPTDAAAVVALAGSASMPKRLEDILSSEAMFNDATGVVAFQFALALAVTGTFEPISAVGAFLVSFVGGLAVGAVIAIAGNIATTVIHDDGLEDSSFHILFEIAMPFCAFLAAEALGVSGILSVCACGFIFTLDSNGSDSTVAESKITSASIWNTISFGLNGFVFVILGLQLPSGFNIAAETSQFTDMSLLNVTVLIALIVVGLRFLGCLFTFAVCKNPDTGKRDSGKELLKTSLISTFGGAKGAITLSVILTIPATFSGKPVLVFICSGVIIATLILANVFVPILSPAKEDSEALEQERNVRIEMLRETIKKISSWRTHENTHACSIVSQEYRQRIRQERRDDPALTADSKETRLAVLEWERQELFKVRTQYPADAYEKYLDYILMREEAAGKKTKVMRQSIGKRMLTVIRIAMRKGFPEKGHDIVVRDSDYAALHIHMCEKMMDMLEDECEEKTNYIPDSQNELLSSLRSEYANMLVGLTKEDPDLDSVAKDKELAKDIRFKALDYELTLIGEKVAAGQITKKTASKMKQEIHIMIFNAEELI